MNQTKLSSARSLDEAEKTIRKELVFLLNKGNAHQPFEAAVRNLPSSLRGIKPEELPYTIWQLVEHIRITQWDILEFSKDSSFESPSWPDEYWPKESAPASEEQWQKSLELIKSDRDAFIALINDSSKDLYEPFPHGTGQNLLREALVIADHSSYHTGQIILVRRLLGAWEG